jgi:hypothetical protein
MAVIMPTSGARASSMCPIPQPMSSTVRSKPSRFHSAKRVMISLVEIETSLLVGDTNEFGSETARLSDFERCSEFGPRGSSILRNGRKSVRMRIAPIARSTVSDRYQQRIAKPAQLRVHADRLVVRMRYDDHDLASDRLALDKGFQNRSGCRAGNHSGSAARVPIPPQGATAEFGKFLLDQWRACVVRL